MVELEGQRWWKELDDNQQLTLVEKQAIEAAQCQSRRHVRTQHSSQATLTVTSTHARASGSPSDHDPVQSDLPVLDPERGAIVPSPDLAADPECSL